MLQLLGFKSEMTIGIPSPDDFFRRQKCGNLRWTLTTAEHSVAMQLPGDVLLNRARGVLQFLRLSVPEILIAW
jgi:hypothetical protein